MNMIKLKSSALEMIEKLSKVEKLSTPEIAQLKGELNQSPKKDIHVKTRTIKSWR